MKTAIYGYKTEQVNSAYHEGYIIFRKSIFISWADALEASLKQLAKDQGFKKEPIVIWFQKL